MSDFYKSIKQKMNIYRRYSYWKRANCIFVHVPKVAGTSISHALYGRTLGHYKADEIKSKFPVLFENCFTFGFVRNPWDRVVSAYRFACVGRTESMGIYKPEQYHIREFESFERFVVDWLPYQNMENLDYVFQPQHIFVTNEKFEPILDFIGKLENIKKDIKTVERKVGFNIELTDMNRTETKKNPLSDLYKNQEMIHIVAEIYRKDIEMFGYSFDDI